MARPITIKALRGAHDDAQVPPRVGVRVIAVFVLLQLLLIAALLLLFPSKSAAAPVKSELSVSSQNGYVRLVFTLAEEIEADVRLANGIIVIGFKRPVDVSVDRIPMQSAGYVNAARADPDGIAVRLALGRKVTVNSMAAGEKLFVDLLPEDWSGLPPGLPQGRGRCRRRAPLSSRSCAAISRRCSSTSSARSTSAHSARTTTTSSTS